MAREHPNTGSTAAPRLMSVEIEFGSPVTLSVFDGDEPSTAPLEAVGDFLRASGEATLVCANAGDFHLLASNVLRTRTDNTGLQLLWDLSAQGRLHDVTLLSELIKLAQ